MPTYLGSGGFIELKRTSMEHSLNASLVPSDVNTDRKRFSVDGVKGNIITGDRISISRTDGGESANLELVSGHNKRDGSWFAHVDDIGGLRLYNTFALAVGGTKANAIALATPSGNQNISIISRNNNYRPLARIEEYEFTTQRDQIEISQLGESYKRQYDNGLLQGQGSMTCFWEHRYVTSDPDYSADQEFSSYLARLILRVQQGTDFIGRFFLYRESANSVNNAWYECTAQVTSCSISIPNVGIIKTNIDFVTSGQFDLKVGSTPGYILQESTDYLLQEDGSKLFLEDDAT
tara:strand:+ start:104 stop:979 length:876 start_codon:yes stop_codon:yes gene_type:complete